MEGDASDKDGGVEMVAPGTDQRNEQEEFEMQIAQESFDRGMQFWTDSKFDDSLRQFMRSLEIREDLRGRCDELTAKGYLWVATVYFHKKELDRALDHLSRAFRIQYEMAMGDSTKCQNTMHWINKVLSAKGVKSVEDKGLYWKKLMKCIEHEGKGDVWRQEGKFDWAIESFRAALHLEYSRRGMNPGTHGRQLVDAADIFVKIGKCYQLQKKHERAMMEFRQAYAIYLAWGGNNQRYALQTWDAMADATFGMGFRAAVIGDYLASMQASIRCEQAGDWMAESKDYDNALQQYKSALELEGKVVGLVQCSVGMVHFKMGKVYKKLDKRQDALIHLCKAVGTFDRILGSDHKYTSTTMKLLQSMQS